MICKLIHQSIPISATLCYPQYIKIIKRFYPGNSSREFGQANKEIKDFLETFEKTHDSITKMNLLHEFILLNAHKSNIRMTVMFPIDISPKKSIFEDIAAQYASKMPDDIFSNQHSFNQFVSELTYKALPLKIEGSSIIERHKKHCVEELMKEFKTNKSKFTPDFVEKDYKGFINILDTPND